MGNDFGGYEIATVEEEEEEGKNKGGYEDGPVN